MTRARSQKKKGRKNTWLALVLLPIVGYAAIFSWPMRATKVEKTHKEEQAPILDHAREREVLRDLVQSHPHPSIRNTLDQLIMHGEVALLLEKTAGIGPQEASFIIRPDERGIMRPILNYPAEHLRDARTSKRYKQLVLYHEWVHFEQQRDRRFSSWLVDGTAPIPLPNDMQQIWQESEVEAYLAECKLAKEWGAENEVELCQLYFKSGKSALRKQVAKNYSMTAIKT